MGISIRRLVCGHEVNGNLYSGPNSAGGISVIFNFANTGDKTIKYASFGFIPYNAVGDAVGCSIRNESERFVKVTGPIGPNQIEVNNVFRDAWYNNSITSVKPTKIYVQYMDGTEEIINGSMDVQTTAAPSSGGCYVATAVYGSYDCPQVWTLRRYRDYILAETWYGRAFIRTYYAISPTLVKWFGHKEWFKKMWRGKLDRMVADLNAEGVKDTPYEDRNW